MRSNRQDRPIIFLSHARRDSSNATSKYEETIKDKVISYLAPFKNDGTIEVVIDESALRVGDNVNNEIRSWIDRGSASICLVSKVYFSREYITNFEIKWLKEKYDKCGDDYIILPLVLDHCQWDKHHIFQARTKLPNHAENETFAEIRDENEIDKILKIAIEQLVERVTSAPQAPRLIQKAVEPVEQSILGTNIYESSNPIIGRQGLIEDCVLALGSQTSIALHGPPGQGKTEVARQVALKLTDNFGGRIFEIDVQNETNLSRVNTLIARSISLQDGVPLEDELSARPYLLVLDGFDAAYARNERGALNDHISALARSMGSKSKLIFTSQTEIPHNAVHAIAVPELEIGYCLQLFHHFSEQRYKSEDEEELVHFIQELNRHTQSVIAIARYVRHQLLPFERVQGIWSREWEQVAKKEHSIDAKELVTSFEITFSALSHAAKRLFLAMPSFPDGIMREGIDAIWPNSGEINEAIDELRSFRLFDDRFLENEKFRLSGPLFKYAEYKREQHKNGSGLIEETIFRDDLSAIDGYYDQFIEQFAPELDDVDPAVRNAKISSQFHNIHCSLDARLDVAKSELMRDEVVISAAEGVLRLFYAYRNNMSGMRSAYASTDDSISYLDKARVVFEANDKPDKTVICLHAIGTIYWLAGKTDVARPYLQDALSSDHCTKDISSHILRTFAHFDYSKGRFKEANEKFQQAGEDFLSIGDEVSYAKCQIGRIDLLRKLCQYEDALEIVSELKNEYDDVLLMNDRANVTRGEAYVLFLTGLFDEAKEAYLRGVDQAIASDSAFSQAHCHRGLGDVLTSQSEFGKANKEFELSLKLYKEAKKYPSLGVALVLLGQARWEAILQNTGSAIKILERVIQMLEKDQLNQPYELAIANSRLGELYQGLARRKTAMRYYKIAKATFEKMGVDAMVADVDAKQLELETLG